MSHLKVVSAQYGVKTSEQALEQIDAYLASLAEGLQVIPVIRKAALANDQALIAAGASGWMEALRPLAIATQDYLELGPGTGPAAREERMMLAALQMAKRDPSIDFALYDNLVRTTYGTEPSCELVLLLLSLVDVNAALTDGVDGPTLANALLEVRRFAGLVLDALAGHRTRLSRQAELRVV